MEVTVIPPIPSQKPHQKVAAYARVSAEREMPEQSLAAQVDYYTKYIKNHPGWELQGVYADYGISGTITQRPGLEQMMTAARQGEIDLIMTKSVTRLARSTVSFLAIIRELKALGVDVYFEEEDIHSLSQDGELMITLLAMYAEEGARTYSELAKRSFQQMSRAGEYKPCRMYGYKIVAGKYEINEAEAKVVRQIFADYLAGSSVRGIARSLNAAGVPKHGKRWRDSMIYTILRNEKYTGNMLLQKRYTTDFRTKQIARNTGELTQYYIIGSHPAIIDKETYDKVAAEIKKRQKNQPKRKKYPYEFLFTSKIRCGQCGSMYQRRVYENYAPDARICYYCSHKKHVDSVKCKNHMIRESTLAMKLKEALDLPADFTLSKSFIDEKVEKIISEEDFHVSFILKDGSLLILPWEYWTPERRKAARRHRAQKLKSQKEEK